MELSAEQLRTVARELLDLRLDETDAEACRRALGVLRESLAHIDRVPLPFNEGVFTEPALATQWLEEWDAEGASR